MYTLRHVHTTHTHVYWHILRYKQFQTLSRALREKVRRYSKDTKKKKRKKSIYLNVHSYTDTETRYTHMQKRRDFDDHAT